MKKSLLIALSIMYSLGVYAQLPDEENFPIVGKPCPEFVLRNIHYYSKKQACLQDFKGKWLVLDFWNKFCGACVASFPRVSGMQKEFGDKAQFMMVAIEDKEKQVEPMFAKFREKENLAMPCAFDSLLANRWEVEACPHIIILDEQGIVRAITSSYTREDMQGFFTGNSPHLNNPFRYDWEKDPRMIFDEKKPFLMKGNGGIDSLFLFRSLLSVFDASKQLWSYPDSITLNADSGMFQALGPPLLILYNYAYYGTTWPAGSDYHTYPVLEIRDSSVFRLNSYNLFCYSLILPPAKATRERMQEIMQRDLQNYFGYDARIEERKFPCWRLVATREARIKLRSKGGSFYFNAPQPHTGFTARNWPFRGLVAYVKRSTRDTIIDETGIEGNIDMSVDWIDTDFDEVKTALHTNGIDLIKDERSMKVLVIKDPSPK